MSLTIKCTLLRLHNSEGNPKSDLINELPKSCIMIQNAGKL